MNHTPSPTPGAPDHGPSMPPADHPDVEREEGPGKPEESDQPEISYEEEIGPGGDDPDGQAEIRHVPAKPELSPTPEHLKN